MNLSWLIWIWSREMLNFKFYKVLLGKFSWIWNNFFDQGPSSFKSNIWLSPTAIIQSHTEFIRKHLNRGFRGLFIYHFCYRKFLPKSSKNAHFDRQDNQEIIFWILSKNYFSGTFLSLKFWIDSTEKNLEK